MHPIEVFTPKGVAVEALGPGEIGFITASIDRRRLPRRRHDYRGPPARGAAPRLAGARGPFAASSRPTQPNYERLRDSLAKLRLNDASFEYDPSSALGFGFRCGLLGLLVLRDYPGAPQRASSTSTCSLPPPQSSTGFI